MPRMLLERFAGPLKRRLNEDPDLIQLCAVLCRAEQLAMRCAAKQVLVCREPDLRRGFAAQQRCESSHARLFDGMLAFVPRKPAMPDSALRLIDAYEDQLDRALRRSALAESVVGLQVVFEHAAAALLRGVELNWRDAPLDPLRRLLVVQEEGHHRFGARALKVLGASEFDEGLARAAEDYAGRTDGLLQACQSMLERFTIHTERLQCIR